MDPDYVNSEFIFSNLASGKNCPQLKGNSTEEQERAVTSPTWTKVLLALLGFSLVCALGGLCALWMIYHQKFAAQENLTELNLNCAEMKIKFNYLAARYNTLRKCVSVNNTQSCKHCANGWIACRGKMYLFSYDKLDWWRSREVCVSKGADLVTITSKSEQDYLSSKIKDSHWIGLHDLYTEGNWVWVNNQTLTETGAHFWSRSGVIQPNNRRSDDPSGENCACMGDGVNVIGSWFDASCKTRNRFICEIQY